MRELIVWQGLWGCLAYLSCWSGSKVNEKVASVLFVGNSHLFPFLPRHSPPEISVRWSAFHGIDVGNYPQVLCPWSILSTLVASVLPSQSQSTEQQRITVQDPHFPSNPLFSSLENCLWSGLKGEVGLGKLVQAKALFVQIYSLYSKSLQTFDFNIQNMGFKKTPKSFSLQLLYILKYTI